MHLDVTDIVLILPYRAGAYFGITLSSAVMPWRHFWQAEQNSCINGNQSSALLCSLVSPLRAGLHSHTSIPSNLWCIFNEVLCNKVQYLHFTKCLGGCGCWQKINCEQVHFTFWCGFHRNIKKSHPYSDWTVLRWHHQPFIWLGDYRWMNLFCILGC